MTLLGSSFYAGANIGEGALTVGLVVAFVEYVNRFFTPVKDLSGKYAVVQSAMAAIERIVSLLDTDEPDAPMRETTDTDPSRLCDPGRRRIIFHGCDILGA